MSSSSSVEVSWIKWFCNLRGNEFFCEVDPEYIIDRFNLIGLDPKVPKYEQALAQILDSEMEEIDDESHQEIELAAEILYGLIHARYIMTNKGLSKMKSKFIDKEFGTCPRVDCDNFAFLPLGQSDTENESMVKMYCGVCEQLYLPRSTKHHHTDGAYFGTGFPQMFFMVNKGLRSKPNEAKKWVPSLYGFRISDNAYKLQHKISEVKRQKMKVREGGET